MHCSKGGDDVDSVSKLRNSLAPAAYGLTHQKFREFSARSAGTMPARREAVRQSAKDRAEYEPEAEIAAPTSQNSAQKTTPPRRGARLRHSPPSFFPFRNPRQILELPHDRQLRPRETTRHMPAYLLRPRQQGLQKAGCRKGLPENPLRNTPRLGANSCARASMIWTGSPPALAKLNEEEGWTIDAMFHALCERIDDRRPVKESNVH